jgi:hypothetical protein
MRLRILPCSSFAALILSISTASAKDPDLNSLSQDHFRDSATVTDNRVEGTTTISTEKGFVEHRGPMRMVWNDEYLSGVIDRKTGQKSFRVYAWVIHRGGLRSYQTARYQTANGPRSVPAMRISQKEENCAVGDCVYTEYVAFPVEEELLRQLASSDVRGKPPTWSFELISKSGASYSGGFSYGEIAGFLAKVDESAEMRSVAKTNAARESLKLDLGIAGIPVDATIELPNRAGILITVVHRDSIAHKSGIIVGDIVYDFDGHPVRELAELEAAIASCTANTLVPIKLYRGTSTLVVNAQF